MAEFSKQYCENHDMGIEGDFDILEIFGNLKINHYISCICEGYGFIAILKDDNNDCLLGIPNYDTDLVDWKKYEEIIK